MVVRIHKPEEGYNSNSGSCKDLVDYLGKENEGKTLTDQEFFYNDKVDRISDRSVISLIDNNKKGLRSGDAKFYMLTINPSEKELAHIANDRNSLVEYTKSVIDEYAAGFNRKIEGRELKAEDLRWFAKIEYNRTYSYDDHKYTDTYQHNRANELKISNLRGELETASVKEKIKIEDKIANLQKEYIKNEKGLVIKPGVDKDGLQTHIHVIISRKDELGKMSLSPFANARKAENELNGKKVAIGFDRDDFTKRCETRFDLSFDYVRGINESIKPLRIPDITKYSPQAIVYKAAYSVVSEAVNNNEKVMKGLTNVKNMANPKEFLIKQVSKEIAKGIAAGSIPVAVPAKVIENLMRQSLNHILRAAEISL